MPPRRRSSSTAVAAWPTTSAPPRSSSAPSWPAPPPASSRSSSSAPRSGRAASARSTDPQNLSKSGFGVRKPARTTQVREIGEVGGLSELVGRAPPGGAAADAGAHEGGAVLGTDAFGGPLGHEVAGVGAAAVEQVQHRLAQVTLEAAELVFGERTGLAPRVEARSPQGLVGGQVAHAGQAGLVHEAGLERCRRPAEGGAQLAEGDGEGVGAEPRLARGEGDAAEPAGVAHAQIAAVAEAEGEAAPLLELPVARPPEVGGGIAAVDEP